MQTTSCSPHGVTDFISNQRKAHTLEVSPSPYRNLFVRIELVITDAETTALSIPYSCFMPYKAATMYHLNGRRSNM